MRDAHSWTIYFGFLTAFGVQGSGCVNYWVGAVDARNHEYAQLMRKFQVEANLHDASKGSLSEQLTVNRDLQVSLAPESPPLDPSLIICHHSNAYLLPVLQLCGRPKLRFSSSWSSLAM